MLTLNAKSIFMNKLVLRNKNIQIAAPSFGKEELDALKEPLARAGSLGTWRVR